MSDSNQRSTYLSAQVEAIHQNLRFLENVVNQPIGLTTDLKSLRESMLAAGASEERDRMAFFDVVEPGTNPQPLGLTALSVASSTLDLLAKLTPAGEESIPREWIERATKVLDRSVLRLGAAIRGPVAENLRGGLYVIVDPEHTRGRPVAAVTREAVAGGAAVIQLRDKLNDKGKVLEAARAIRDICEKADALFIANDDADVALLSNAHGLHVGQKDLPLSEARQAVGSAQIIGVSNAAFGEALAAESDGADYVAVGTIYDTATKSETRSAGLETLKQVSDAVIVPVVAIGGINETNIATVLEAGADSICVLSAVTSVPDPRAASAKLAEIIDKAV